MIVEFFLRTIVDSHRDSKMQQPLDRMRMRDMDIVPVNGIFKRT